MLANPTPKEDSWAFLPIGSPLPDNLVSVFGHENAFVALWYKNGSPVHGYAWSESDGTLQASFPYGTAELTGEVDVDGMIQVLQYNGDHNSLGFWYHWVKYGDRHEQQQQQLDSQPLRCGHSMPILWPNRAGGPLLGSLDLKTEQARFSQAGKVEMVDGKPLEQMLILVRCHKGGPPDCECPKCQRGPPAAKHVRWDSVVQEECPFLNFTAVISEVDLTSNNNNFGAGNLDSTFDSAVDLDAIFTNAEQKPDNNNADKAGDMDADTALQQSESDCTASGCSSRSASSVSVDVIPNVVDSPAPDNSKNKDNKLNGCGVNSSEDSSPDNKKDIEQTKKAAEEAIKAHNNGFYIGLMTKEEAELMWTPRFRLYHRVESNPLRDIDLPLCLVFRCPSGKHFRHFRIRCRHGRQGVDVEGEPQFKALSELITFYDNFDRNLKQLKRNNKRK